MFDKIITITLNPSLDTTLWVDQLDFMEPVVAKQEQFHPGGKAINVSRVLTALGVKSKAIGIVGSENATRFINLLDNEGISYDFIMVSGQIRENLSIVFPDKGMLKINRIGFEASKHAIDLLCEKLEYHLQDCTNALLVFAGSLPKNVTALQYKEMVMKFCSANYKVALDTDLFSYQDLKEIKPFIIKPNQVELAHIANREFEDITQMKEYAAELSHFTEHVLVSVGDKGLVYAGNHKVLSCIPPKVEVLSTVGAGDTTLAGFIKSLNENKPIDECLAYAVACGTASVLLEGTAAITKQGAAKMLEKVYLEP